MEDILKKIIVITGFAEEIIKGENRQQDIVAARALFTKECKKKGYSLTSIGRRINRDHSDIYHLNTKYKPTVFFREYQKMYYSGQ
jgi:chromosomal replication initiation ATPase DnaA